MNLEGNPTRNRIRKASFWSILYSSRSVEEPATKLSSDILGLSGFDKNESAKHFTLFQSRTHLQSAGPICPNLYKCTQQQSHCNRAWSRAAPCARITLHAVKFNHMMQRMNSPHAMISASLIQLLWMPKWNRSLLSRFQSQQNSDLRSLNHSQLLKVDFTKRPPFMLTSGIASK